MQQRIADGKGSIHCKNVRCERARKGTLWFRPDNVLWKSFRNQRSDGIVINKYHWTLYILEFKQSSDRNKDFLRVKEDEANEQHRSIIEALRAPAPECMFEQINFVAGSRGAVVEDDFYNKLEKFNVQAGKRDKILLAHVQRICEAHDTVQVLMNLNFIDPPTRVLNYFWK